MVGVRDIHIEPRLISEALETPVMRDLRDKAAKRFQLKDDRTARSFAERLLTHAVERFSVDYLNEMSAHIEHAFRLRDQAASMIDRVIGPEALSAESAGAQLERLFKEIKGDLDAVTDPAAFIKKTPARVPDVSDIQLDLVAGADTVEATPARDPADAPSAAGRHVEILEPVSTTFKALSQRARKATRRAADLAPRELWRAVSSETEGGLDRSVVALADRARAGGMSPSDIEALEGAVRTLSKERARAQRGPGSAEAVMRGEGVAKLVAHLEAALTGNEALLKTYGLDRLSPAQLREHLNRLQTLVRGNRYLELLAAENPDMLLDLFESSGAKSKTALQTYIRRRMTTHIRGLTGEFAAAFSLGEQGVVLIKGPDYDVTIPGTDLVGVTRDGRVWLIDNKAMSASELTSVNALTRNIAKNISDDAADAMGRFGAAPDPVIGDAVLRLDRATQAIRSITQGLSPEQIASPQTQGAITAICNVNGIDRVVTNAGGKIQGLSAGLRQAGILFEDLN